MLFAQLSTLSAHTSYYAVRCIAEFSYNICHMSCKLFMIHLRLGPKELMKTRLNTNTQKNESVNRTLTKTNPKFGTWRRTLPGPHVNNSRQNCLSQQRCLKNHMPFPDCII
jgi:hypothetical protein